MGRKEGPFLHDPDRVRKVLLGEGKEGNHAPGTDGGNRGTCAQRKHERKKCSHLKAFYLLCNFSGDYHILSTFAGG